MAEFLGVIAGGAGLISLAGQLVEATDKLRRFYQTFKGKRPSRTWVLVKLMCADADRRIRRLASDIETLSMQLRLTEIDRVNHGTGDAEVFARCIQMGQVSTGEISRITERLVAISARYAKLWRHDRRGTLLQS